MNLPCCLALLATTVSLLAADPKSVPIFDGKSLEHWSGKAEHWRVEDGAITGEIPAGQTLKGNEWIFWDGEVHDFDLSVEYRITGGPSANSGIQYRCQRGENGHASGYQADLDQGAMWLGRIYDEHGRALLVERGSRVSIAPDGRRWADVFAEPKSFLPIIKKDEWNTYRITAKASHVEVRVNDVLFSVLDDHEAKAAEFAGKIAFQLHSGPGPAKIQFRNIQLTRLGQTTMPVRAEVKEAPRPADTPGVAPPAELNLGFETGTLAGWKIEGNAWEKQPVEGDSVAARNHGSSQHVGKFWLGGYERIGDHGTGTLTSASFEVTQPWASFLIGGGHDAKTVRVEIVEEATGKVIQSASGLDQENLRRVAVKLDGLIGKRIFIRIIDQGTRGWGHMNFDDFMFHEKQPAMAVASAISISGDRSKRDSESPVLWHLLPNPAKPTSIANAEAQKLVAGMKLTQGFQVELIAAEPDVRQPIAFCFDERGRMWVAEAFSYPNKQPDGKGKDRIGILEDADGDGSFETHKVFIDGLNLVSGIEIGFGGVWVGAAPELLFIPKDANDQPGKPQVLLDGWGYQDTHETLNSFIWGPDGWLYGNQGVFTRSLIGKPGTPDAQRITLNAGVWRYHPVRHEFEIFCHGGSNQWGLDYNSNGHFFMTHCRSFHGKGGTTHAIRNGHFWNQSNSNYAPFISATAPVFAPELQNYLPASARYDSGEGGAGKPGTTAVYGGHSHVGTMIYNGDNFPAIYRDHLFTHNLHGHQMNQQHNVRSGSGYETLHAGYDLMFCGDERYIPVDLQTGPDGAVYVIDWTDTQHCHNPDDEKWDRSNGRIYRISWKEMYKPVKVDLSKMSDADFLLMQTGHETWSSMTKNDWYARTARRLMQERGGKYGEGERPHRLLHQLASDQGLTREQKLHVLWSAPSVLAGMNDAADALNGLLQDVIKDQDDIVRSWAIQLATEQSGKPKLSAATLLELAKNDSSPTVRLALASALPKLDAKTVWEVASALALHGEDKDDRFLPKMIWFGLARVIAEDWARGLALAEKTPLPSLADSIRWFAATNAAGREALVPSITTERGLQVLAFGMKDEARAPMPNAWPQLKNKFFGQSAIIDQLSALFGDQTVLAKMRGILADAAQPMPQRRSAFDLLKRIGDAEAAPIFARLLDVPEFSSAVIPLLSRSNDPVTAIALMQRFAKLSQDDRRAALNTLTSRAELALPLLAAVKAGTFDKKHLSSLQIRQMRNLNHAEVNALLDATWGKVNESSEVAKASIAKFKKAYESAPLWAFNAGAGAETFKQVCAVCHPMNGVGGKLGPDLAGSWRNGLDYFLENIIDPNAVVGDNFQLHVLTKKDGSVISGVIEQETDSAITARTVTESVIVAKDDLKGRQKLPVSIMPPGLLEALPERKALELLKYLLSKRE